MQRRCWTKQENQNKSQLKTQIPNGFSVGLHLFIEFKEKKFEFI